MTGTATRSALSGTAIISDCGTYRYVLTRSLPSVLRWIKPWLFVMLNPSTATSQTDDATIRRCIGFATRAGATTMTVVNLFALRATDPAALRIHPDPVGPDNDRHLCEQIEAHRQVGVIIGAWGAHPFAKSRISQVAPLLEAAGARCLGTTREGHPRHPLYLPANIDPCLWTAKP